MIITDTSDIEVNIQGYYDRNLLVRALPSELHARFLQSRPVPRNAGTRINFRRFASLPISTASLAEGVTPTGQKSSVTNIYAVLEQFGGFMTISDWISMVGLDNTLVEHGELLGEQMGLTLDTIIRDRIICGTSIRYASGVDTRANIAAAIGQSDTKATVRILESNNAKKIKSIIIAGSGVGTRPVPPAFYCITHTNCRQDWEDITGFQKVHEYASQKDVMDEEIGSWGNIRVLVTSNAKVFPDAGAAIGTSGMVSTTGVKNDVYTSLVLAKNAAGVIPLQKATIKNIIKKLGSGGSSDPLDQRGTSGWKAATAAKILDDGLMVRIEHACTDL